VQSQLTPTLFFDFSHFSHCILPAPTTHRLRRNRVRDRNDVEPYAYLHDVLTRMVDGHPINRLDELLPWAWKAGDSVKS
jgi:hypothetical protein